MPTDIKVPEIGESVSEATISRWLIAEGEQVERDESIVEIETDKVSLEIPSPASGVLGEIVVREGETARVGDVIARLSDSDGAPAKGRQADAPASRRAPQTASKEKASNQASSEEAQPEQSEQPQQKNGARRNGPQAARHDESEDGDDESNRTQESRAELKREPREQAPAPAPTAAAHRPDARGERRERLSPIRRRIAQRLVEASQTSAMLTTFNEVDMTAVLSLRSKWGEQFEQVHGVRLGFMSLFVRASVEALREFPRFNAMIDGQDVVYRDYIDIAIAISTDAGLVTPVLRNVWRLSLADIERHIADFAVRARSRELTIDELTGGTFTITNGGVFGSLLSTPILNPPQTGILGMHTIQDRPVAVDGAVVIRPMMYLALTYDHRLVDGREAVLFLNRVRDTVAEPSRLLLRL
ncbi:MAG: 2-oxoglutarate dehydrogenase complex dihydrolipoyllysine-residue succinyltransferase [Phycisphaerales bacterium]|nr:2-oxoglutarate dehydrogenase complex dihydrolipoyllysine-residue succinyltransferase [Phycisphaerales bacterium]